jgi:hypothetical protein
MTRLGDPARPGSGILRFRWHRVHRAVGVVCLLFAAWIVAPGSSSAELPDEVSGCLDCHADDSLTHVFDDGTEMSLYVDGDAFMESVHGGALVCTDCHEGYEEEHPDFPEVGSIRAYTQASYDLCKRCHFDTYTRTLESVHYTLIQEGRTDAPVCADCHGAHGIQKPETHGPSISKSCGHCHSGVYAEYAVSVHGAALQGAPDLPGCPDCHTAHTIQDPRNVAFHLNSPATCLRCHGDQQMMKRHGIATTIGTTYLGDFHGVTASLADPSKVTPEEVVVVCVDCHGVHDIASVVAIGPVAMKTRVEKACRKCHQDASPDFPSAWLSHYPPSLSHAPLVFLVKVFYWIFIPFIVVGLAVQVLFHLYRVGIRR